MQPGYALAPDAPGLGVSITKPLWGQCVWHVQATQLPVLGIVGLMLYLLGLKVFLPLSFLAALA
jgi:hypothetical protein